MSISRRSFLTGLSSVAAASAGVFAKAPAVRRGYEPAQALRIDGQKLRERIEALSVFGRPPGGSFASGVSRVAYSDADVAGRQYVTDLMKKAGLEPRIDPAGNIFARRAGSDPSLRPILFGSHIDSVPSGGNFDGDLGSLAALSVVEACESAGLRTRHPLEVVVWSAEEGVAFGRGLAGSRIVAGDVKASDMDAVWNGLRRADGIKKLGGSPDRIMDAVRPKGAHHAYLELHIEQGGTLERGNVPVGVVEGIVAIERYTAFVTGFANHAGTTPMAERRDALIAASQLTLAIRESVTKEPGRQVGTVGQLEVSPNAPNVIPGSVRLTIELRDLSTEKLAGLIADIRQRARQIASSTKTEIEISELSRNPSALASPEIQRVIGHVAGSIGLQTTRLPSGAGHDAQMMAQLGPMGMIFVPSVGGISHSPKELTRWQDCANGANVLLHSVLELDRT
jgi:beta-ureidopropionase / N-carbamoyl-L-amino-acid hydrolase